MADRTTNSVVRPADFADEVPRRVSTRMDVGTSPVDGAGEVGWALARS